MRNKTGCDGGPPFFQPSRWSTEGPCKSAATIDCRQHHRLLQKNSFLRYPSAAAAVAVAAAEGNHDPIRRPLPFLAAAAAAHETRHPGSAPARPGTPLYGTAAHCRPSLMLPPARRPPLLPLLHHPVLDLLYITYNFKSTMKVDILSKKFYFLFFQVLCQQVLGIHKCRSS